MRTCENMERKLELFYHINSELQNINSWLENFEKHLEVNSDAIETLRVNVDKVDDGINVIKDQN